MSSDLICVHCEEGKVPSSVSKCPICHKHVCGDHHHSMSGRYFCSKGCAEYFFFSDPDDTSDDIE